MIARLLVLTDFHLAVPEGVPFTLFEFATKTHSVRFRIPARSDNPPPHGQPDILKIDGTNAYFADVLLIDFCKEGEFDRRTESEFEVSVAEVQESIDFYISRLRFVTRGPSIRSVSYPACSWQLRYLNDDGSELVEQEGLVRMRGAVAWTMSVTAVTPDSWKSIFTLPLPFVPPVWDTLRLDARNAMPHIGSAIVLSMTALEVFAGSILNDLAKNSTVPSTMWEWITERSNPDRRPDLEEQFDILLKVLTGHSLKDQPLLWDAFKKLKTARNKFVHEGVAMAYGETIEEIEANRLLGKVDDIISKIREWIPEAQRWPAPSHPCKIEMSKFLTGKPQNAADKAKAPEAAN